MNHMSKIQARYLFLFSFIFFVSCVTFTFATTSPPSLDEVLKKPSFSFDLSFLVWGFFAFSLGSLSVAKTYEIYKKTKNQPRIELLQEDESQLEKIKAELSFITVELKRKEEEEERFKKEIKNLEGLIDEGRKSEEILKRSASSLRKDYEKLLIEKERLTLELNRQNGIGLFAEPKNEEPQSLGSELIIKNDEAPFTEVEMPKITVSKRAVRAMKPMTSNKKKVSKRGKTK